MQPITPPSQFLTLPVTGWAPPSPEARAERLAGQVDEFASMLYAQMFQQMREAAGSGEEGGIFSGDAEMFAHFFDQQVGKAFAASEGNGLKAALSNQLSKTLEAQSKAKGENQ